MLMKYLTSVEKNIIFNIYIQYYNLFVASEKKSSKSYPKYLFIILYLQIEFGRCGINNWAWHLNITQIFIIRGKAVVGLHNTHS